MYTLYTYIQAHPDLHIHTRQWFEHGAYFLLTTCAPFPAQETPSKCWKLHLAEPSDTDINRSMLPVHTHTHTHTPSASTSCPSFTTCVTSCTHPHLVLQFSVRFHVSLLPTLHKDSLAALPNAHSLTPLHKNLSCFLKWHGISTVENMFILKFYSM